ncbi:50S ribosomal protein L11 methyltransferase [Telmatospirillum sp.]|uniref:class I SAM-dependent methyltransferase n=1 Tax=Telmatospirillum sp. TaxID=2079197 RepID=UPI00284DC92D|nr:50S ribosomal protein L11 methyltransferase [Telmatospirillum sp.]MDR3435936.1 50S ribosomal protein L11 methyltransferase [Telmatospirillum sp.]
MRAQTEAFIEAHTIRTSPPACPEIALHLATEITPLWLATEDFLHKANLEPPYWAFAWVGGQALSRYVLDTPALVRGKRVLDFAAGCGMTAIAAALAGASSSQAAEIDPTAAAAISLNAKINNVDIEILLGDVLDRPDCPWDVILAGDVCYERPMAERVFAWLRRCAATGADVLMADPGRAYLPHTGLLKMAAYTIACSLELEDRTSRDAVVYKIVG